MTRLFRGPRHSLHFLVVSARRLSFFGERCAYLELPMDVSSRLHSFIQHLVLTHTKPWTTAHLLEVIEVEWMPTNAMARCSKYEHGNASYEYFG